MFDRIHDEIFVLIFMTDAEVVTRGGLLYSTERIFMMASAGELTCSRLFPVSTVSSKSSMSMSTTEKATETTEGKKAENAPPTHLGWDSHKAVVRI